MAETDEAQVMEEGFLTFEERVSRASRKIKYAQGLEKEADGLKKKAKELLEIAQEARDQSDELILEKPNPQIEMPIAKTGDGEPNLEICAEQENGQHEWERLRDGDGVILEQCALCSHERTARTPEDGAAPIWTYLPDAAYGTDEPPPGENGDAAAELERTEAETAPATAPEVPANAG